MVSLEIGIQLPCHLLQGRALKACGFSQKLESAIQSNTRQQPTCKYPNHYMLTYIYKEVSTYAFGICKSCCYTISVAIEV